MVILNFFFFKVLCIENLKGLNVFIHFGESYKKWKQKQSWYLLFSSLFVGFQTGEDRSPSKKKKVERQIYFLKYNRKSSIVFVRITVQLSVTEIKRAYFTLYRFDCLRNLIKKKKKNKGLNCNKTHRVWFNFNETLSTFFPLRTIFQIQQF